MKRPIRTAAIVTVSFIYGVLWVAFVTIGDEPPRSEGALHWLLSLSITLVLIGMLFLAGLIVAAAQKTGGWTGSRQKAFEVPTVIAALVTVGALLGLLPCLRAVLWGGPAWLRWVIVGAAIATLMIGSGRAVGWATLGGLIWIMLGVWRGGNRELADRIDMVLTDLMVGTTVGAVWGTLWSWRRGRKKPQAE